MGIFGKKIDYVAVGKTGTTDEFLAAYNKRKKDYYDNYNKNADLTEGAIEAFHAGRPENIQARVFNEKNISELASLLLDVTRNSENKLRDLNLALAIRPEKDKQLTIDQMFRQAVESNIGGEPFFSLLIQTGADANAQIPGMSKDSLLAKAIQRKAELPVIQLLYDHGASFDDALMAMHRGYNYKSEDIERLKFFQEKIEGAPATVAATKRPAVEDSDVSKTLNELKEQISDLTGVVVILAEEVKSLKSSTPPVETQPKNNPAPPVKKSYPAVKGL